MFSQQGGSLIEKIGVEIVHSLTVDYYCPLIVRGERTDQVVMMPCLAVGESFGLSAWVREQGEGVYPGPGVGLMT